MVNLIGSPPRGGKLDLKSSSVQWTGGMRNVDLPKDDASFVGLSANQRRSLAKSRIRKIFAHNNKMSPNCLLGHVLREEKCRLLQLRKIVVVGGMQKSGLRNIWQWTGVHEACEIFRLTEDREAIVSVIANVRRTGQGTSRRRIRYERNLQQQKTNC